MVTIEVNGQRVEASTEKEAKKMLAKLLKQEKAAQAKRNAEYQAARQKGEALAYRILSRLPVLTAEPLPDAWRYYEPHHKFAEHLYRKVEDKRDTHALNTEARYGVVVDHYGLDLVGAACNGSGFCWLIFLRDRYGDCPVTCYAVGVEGDTHALVECPGVTADLFRHGNE